MLKYPPLGKLLLVILFLTYKYMFKNTYIIIFIILAIGFLFYKTFIYYKKQSLIKQILQEWKGQTMVVILH